jgi:3-phenylpropionate/cinnamic acid dioxygenase small subunit
MLDELAYERAIDILQRRYAAALDAKDMQAWLDCFAPAADSAYICTVAENLERGLELAFMYDDCYGRLQDRVTFVTDIWRGTFQDYRTRHFVERTVVRMSGERVFEVRSNFGVFYTPEDTGQTSVLAAGIYQDRVRVQDDGQAHFIAKQVIMDTSVMPRYLVYPL